jgi:polysaccharide biosynthesis protein PslG
VLAAERVGVSFGGNEHDNRSPGALSMMATAGVRGGVRLYLYWNEVQSTRDRWDWSVSDLLLAQAQALGLAVVGGLGYGVPWASTAPWWVFGAAARSHYPPSDYGAWANYVRAAVARYPQVTHWEIWNEPDTRGYWNGTAAQYARLLAVAAAAVHDVNPAATVIFGGLAMGGSSSNLQPNFFAQVLDDPTYPGVASFDVAAVHLYGSNAEAKRRMDYVRGQLSRVGLPARPIWVTETGASSDPAQQPDVRYQGLAGQADWLAMALPAILDQLGAERVFWYTLWDDPTGGAAYASHGLVDGGLAPKPAYDRLRVLLSG